MFKRTNKKRTYRRRRTFKKRTYNGNSKFKSAVKNVINRIAELKISDQNLTAQNAGIQLDIPYSGRIINLGLLGQIVNGTGGPYNRIGNNIKTVSLKMRFNVYIPNAGDTTNNIRVCLLQWRNPAVTLTTIQQIIYNYSTAGFDWISPYNDQSAGQFRVLYDKNLTLNAAGRRLISVRKVFHKMDKKITYDINTGLPKYGEYFLILISDSTVPVHPVIDGNFRLKYIDI